MKILVTGGAGFIGSHVADALIEAGHQVHVLDNFSTGRMENVPAKAVLHKMDVRSEEIPALFARERFDVLAHLAAQMDVRKSVADPKFDADVNIMGILNLLEAGRVSGLKKVVFASTGGAIYGEPVYTPQDEDHPLQPVSPYGVSKLTSEKYLYFYRQQYGISYVALRFANIYGPRQNPHGEAGVVAIFTQRLLAGEQPFINGDGLQTRDYVYVGDVVDAFTAALSYENDGVFNVGTGIETDVNTLFRIIRDRINADVPEKHVEGKPGEQRRSVLSYEKTRAELGWAPKVDLKTGLQLTVDWFKAAASNR